MSTSSASSSYLSQILPVNTYSSSTLTSSRTSSTFKMTLSPLRLILLSTLLLANGVSAEIQAYYKACHGKWRANTNFREPKLVRKFSARPSEFKSLDCATVCGTVNDFVFLTVDPTDSSKVVCSCVAATDPNWVYNLVSVLQRMTLFATCGVRIGKSAAVWIPLDQSTRRTSLPTRHRLKPICLLALRLRR
ncbi:hypothetical protein BC829DRAFT_269400 [Chytridium lagenaria]|nr:hypothetical protein BC829DRAFT_269400 [Chytridium lagenaria]